MQGTGLAPARARRAAFFAFRDDSALSPLTSIILLKHGKLWSMLISLCYLHPWSCWSIAFVQPHNAIEVIPRPAPPSGRVALAVLFGLHSGCSGRMHSAGPVRARLRPVFADNASPYSIIPGISETLRPYWAARRARGNGHSGHSFP